MTVLRRLDAVLEPTKQAVLDMKASARRGGHHQPGRGAAPGRRAGVLQHLARSRCATSKPGPASSSSRPTSRPTSTASRPTCRRSSTSSSSATRSRASSKADVLGTLIEKFLDPTINLSPNPVLERRRHRSSIPGLDNHAMGTIFEELVRRFNEENNEEAGEHWTPRDAVKLMAELIFLPIADQIESGTYLLYDGACGTGGMLTVAEETLQRTRRASTASRSPPTSTARRSTPKPTPSPRPTCCSRARARRPTTSSAARTSTLSNDAFPSREFDFMLSNPPYGKSWKSDLERMGGKDGMQGPALRHRARRRPGILASSPAPATASCCSWQHAVQDEARHAARQPHRRGAQRLVAVHRRRRAGREQHPPLDHRERLAGSHRRPAAEHVLQHRHRHLHLGADQPQAGRIAGARCS